MPAASAPVAEPSNAPGSDPANRATIQSGDITSWKRSWPRNNRIARASTAGPMDVNTLANAKLQTNGSDAADLIVTQYMMGSDNKSHAMAASATSIQRRIGSSI